MEKTRHDSALNRFTLMDVTDRDFDSMCQIHVAAILAISNNYYRDEVKESWARGLIPIGYAAGRSRGEHYRVLKSEGDDVLGFSSTQANEVVALYVNPKHQGKGIGGALLQDAEAQIRSNGASAGNMTASLNAEPFYVSRGWQTQSQDEWKSRGGLMLPVVKMTKSFDSGSDRHVQ